MQFFLQHFLCNFIYNGVGRFWNMHFLALMFFFQMVRPSLVWLLSPSWSYLFAPKKFPCSRSSPGPCGVTDGMLLQLGDLTQLHVYWYVYTECSYSSTCAHSVHSGVVANYSGGPGGWHVWGRMATSTTTVTVVLLLHTTSCKPTSENHPFHPADFTHHHHCPWYLLHYIYIYLTNMHTALHSREHLGTGTSPGPSHFWSQWFVPVLVTVISGPMDSSWSWSWFRFLEYLYKKCQEQLAVWSKLNLIKTNFSHGHRRRRDVSFRLCLTQEEEE